MLKRFYRKKLTLCILVLFALFLIYIIPENKEKLNIKEELTYVDSKVKTADIFLLDSNNYLSNTKIVINEKKEDKIINELISALIIDGIKQDSIPNGFKAIIPANTQILDLKIDDDLVKINFSDELLNCKEENEIKIIEAIVYTITSIDKFKNVMIYLNNDLLTYLPKSKITLPTTLNRSIGINKEYNIINLNDINKTTIYYISKFNDLEYYVPVTKINNDKRDKIEIIIDELSSNNVYKTNLMSYLNSNTRLISVSENSNELSLDFNNAIFNDINDKQILEEVIYTISKSVMDNYNVNSVIFNVDNEEIYKSVIKTIE